MTLWICRVSPSSDAANGSEAIDTAERNGFFLVAVASILAEDKKFTKHKKLDNREALSSF